MFSLYPSRRSWAKSHLDNKLIQAVTLGGGRSETLVLPSAALDLPVSPRCEAGYQLPSAFGEFTLAYRFL